MGMCLDATGDMGDFEVEVRRESFKLYGGEGPSQMYADQGRTGGIEISIADIPKVRAALDLVEEYLNRGRKVATSKKEKK